jgi:hypothetical protein
MAAGDPGTGTATRRQKTAARIVCILAGIVLTLYAGLKVWLSVVTGVADYHPRHGGGTVVYTLADNPQMYWVTIGGAAILVALGLVLLVGGIFGRGWRG